MNVLWVLIVIHSVLIINGNESPSFRSLKKEKYFIDKSTFLRDVLADENNVISINAPSGFGKTSILRMVQEFLTIVIDESGKEAENKSNSKNFQTFKDLEIARETSTMDKYLGQYPVIHIDLKDIKGVNIDTVVRKLKQEVSRIFGEQSFLLRTMKDRLEYCEKVLQNSSSVPKEDFAKLEIEEFTLGHAIPSFEKCLNVSTETEDYNIYDALKFLCKLLYDHFKKRVYILVDRFDEPITSALHMNLDVGAVNNHIEKFLAGVVRANENVEKIIFMGVLNVQRFSASSGLNTIKPYIFLENQYSEYFGYTDSEVSTLLRRYGIPTAEAKKVKNYYNGYLITYEEQTASTVYNQLSINEYLRTRLIENHWTRTGSSDFVKSMLYNKDTEADIYMLIRHKEPLAFMYDPYMCIEEIRDAIRRLHGICGRGHTNNRPVYSYLFAMGYFTKLQVNDDREQEFQLPNQEVKEEFEEQMKHFFRAKFAVDPEDLKTTSNAINCLLVQPEADLSESIKKLEKILKIIAEKTKNRTDTGKPVPTDEKYYYSVLNAAVTLGVHFKEFTPENMIYTKSGVHDRPVLVIRNNTGTENKHVAVVMTLNDQNYYEPEDKLDVERYLIKHFDKNFLEKLTIRRVDINALYEVASPVVRISHTITSVNFSKD